MSLPKFSLKLGAGTGTGSSANAGAATGSGAATGTGAGTSGTGSGLKIGAGVTGGSKLSFGLKTGTSTTTTGTGLKLGGLGSGASGTATSANSAPTAGAADAGTAAGSGTAATGAAGGTGTGFKLGGGLGGGLKLGGSAAGTGAGTTGLGSSTLGSSTGASAAQQQVFVRMDTLFSALPANYKQAFTETETLIRNQSAQRDRIQDQINSMMQRSGSGSAQAQAEAIDTLAQQLSQLYMNVCAEAKRLEDLKQKVTAEVRYAEIADANMTRLCNEDSVYSGTGIRESILLPSQYHLQKLHSYGVRAEEIRRRIEELSEALSLEAGIYGSGHDFDGLGGGSGLDQVALLQQVLAEQYEAIIAVASNVEALARAAQELRTLYLDVHRQVTGQDASHSSLFKHRESNIRMDMDSGSFRPYSSQATTTSAPTLAAANAALVAPTDAQGNPIVVQGTLNTSTSSGTAGTTTGTTGTTGTTSTGLGLSKPGGGLSLGLSKPAGTGLSLTKPAGTGFSLSKPLGTTGSANSNPGAAGTGAANSATATAGTGTTGTGAATGTATTGTTTSTTTGTTSSGFKLGSGTSLLGAKRAGEGTNPPALKPLSLSLKK